MHPSGTIKAPASPRTTRACGAERDGQPGKVKTIGGGGKAEEWRGAGINSILTAEFAV
ncbi:MAG: hypothetical protein GQ533_04755 [Methanosarcinaceae archaeon]|nr:hypothetical protein [Methanosarcinaceae archaeon]